MRSSIASAEKDFFGSMRRLGLLLNPGAEFGPFKPTGDTVPFRIEEPEYSVGYRFQYPAAAFIGPRSFGWTVVFDVYMAEGSRKVVAELAGNANKSEALKLARLVLQSL